MTRSAPRFPATAAVLLAGVALLAGCTGVGRIAPVDSVPAELSLVAFDDCADLLAGLRTATKATLDRSGDLAVTTRPGVVPETITGPEVANGARAAAPDARQDGAGAQKATDPGTGYSGTNNHEQGVEEPDLVKTDGRRLVTVSGGVLRIVDPGSRRLTGTLELSDAVGDTGPVSATDLLLAGDRGLVLAQASYREPATTTQKKIAALGPVLILVDLTGAPRVLGTFRMDGSLVDARQVGPTVRVVVRSTPQIIAQGTGIAAARRAVDAAPVENWLPAYTVTTADRESAGHVPCTAVSRPTRYSGTAMLTVLTFDLERASLGTGDPVTVVADGSTVYSTGSSLIVAADSSWLADPVAETGAATGSDGSAAPASPATPASPGVSGRPASPARPGASAKSAAPATAATPDGPSTQLYHFDTPGRAKPRFTAAGAIPGWLLNQYSLGEYGGHLRVATTAGSRQRTGASTEATVYTLRRDGGRLSITGQVGGLGKGERIYAVRFVGPVGYVVTFRQTDPLYTVDLHDPANPRLLGELELTGYSAYLHPIGDGRLIGVGQEATEQGRRQGTQVSLFDVSDLASPRRLARYLVRRGNSEAEVDPHAFLYWPQTGTLVIPVSTPGTAPTVRPGVAQPNTIRGTAISSSALVLSITADGIVERGAVDHGAAPVRRALVIDGTLWTISDTGAKATDLATLTTQAWLPW